MTKEQCNKKEMCVMCLMPKDSDDGVRENKNFCSYCFKDGKVQFYGEKENFIKMCKSEMRKNGMSNLKSSIFAWSINFAPWWKKNFDKEKAVRGE